MTEAMDKMSKMQEENSKMHKEMIDLLKERAETAKRGQSSSAADTNTYEDEGDRKHSIASASRPRVNKPKPNRPIIQEECNDMGWVIFRDSWDRYKKIAGLEEESEICLELREACSPEVNRLLYQYVGVDDLNKAELTEKMLMEHIRKVAVKDVHEEVYRWDYNNLSQKQEEPITKYMARRRELCCATSM